MGKIRNHQTFYGYDPFSFGYPRQSKIYGPITNLSLYLLAITPADQQSGRLPAAENKRQHAAQKNSLAMPIFEED